MTFCLRTVATLARWSTHCCGCRWFTQHLPRIRKEVERQGHEVLEFVQQPGETVFVPGDWWHTVINVENTIAVTQNFASTTNFPEVWRATRVSRRRLASRWLKSIRTHRPDLASVVRWVGEESELVWDGQGEMPHSVEQAIREHQRGNACGTRAVGTDTARRSDDDNSESDDSGHSPSRRSASTKRKDQPASSMGRGDCGGDAVRSKHIRFD